MLTKQSKEILVEIFPKIIRYSIPLYLPQERLHFNAPEIVLEVPFTNFEFVDLKQLQDTAKKAPRKIHALAEWQAYLEKSPQMS